MAKMHTGVLLKEFNLIAKSPLQVSLIFFKLQHDFIDVASNEGLITLNRFNERFPGERVNSSDAFDSWIMRIKLQIKTRNFIIDGVPASKLDSTDQISTSSNDLPYRLDEVISAQ